jgi:hypothetical protein
MTPGEDGGQLLGRLDFNYWIVPLESEPDPVSLTRLGQQLGAGIGQWQLDMAQWPARRAVREGDGRLPPKGRFLRVEGKVVVSAIKAGGDGAWIIRLFNPGSNPADCAISRPGSPINDACLCDLNENPVETLKIHDDCIRIHAPARRILTIRFS